MVDLSPYFQNHLAEEVYEACLARESKQAEATPTVKLEPEILALKCERALWLGLSGSRRQIADGLLARRLERKRLVRRLVARDLRRAGFRVEWTGRLNCGYVHGITRRPHLLEIQPVKDHIFRRLEKFGLGAITKLEITVQCRMGYTRMDRALFVAENNNTQELYFERVQFDPEIFNQIRSHIGEVMESEIAPKGVYDEECIRCGFRSNCRDILIQKE